MKYLNYLTGIANRYLQEKKSCPALRMIVIYTGDIKRKQVAVQYNIGAVKISIEPAFLSELDREGVLSKLTGRIMGNQKLTDEELMELIILPLAYRKKEEKEEGIHKVVELAEKESRYQQELAKLRAYITELESAMK